MTPLVDTLAHCAEQAEKTQTTPDAYRWLTIGLVIAMQEACVLALTAYDTAERDAILVSGKQTLAPLQTLVRRVQSETYLVPPDKLALPGATVRKALALQEARNLFTHLLPTDRMPALEALTEQIDAALSVIEWLAVTHPAFDNSAISSASKAHIEAIRTALSAAK